MERQIKIIGYVFAAIIAVVVAVFVFSKCDRKPIKVVPDPKSTRADSTTTANQRRKIATLDSLLNVKNDQIATCSANLAISRQKNSNLRSANDSLSAYYSNHHTLQNCDSLVITKQRYIVGLQSENDSLYRLNGALCETIDLSKKKIARMDTIVNSKETVIEAYARQMERINCMSEWAIKHRFLAWLLRIKCNK
jgi:hypothetical protein